MRIYVKTPYGTRFHGTFLPGLGIFTRHIDHSYIRWSDKCFPLNHEAYLKLKKLKCTTVRFNYKKAETIDVYEIAFEDLADFPAVVNEHDEKNIRIPMDKVECKSSTPLTEKIAPAKVAAKKKEEKKTKTDKERMIERIVSKIGGQAAVKESKGFYKVQWLGEAKSGGTTGLMASSTNWSGWQAADEIIKKYAAT